MIKNRLKYAGIGPRQCPLDVCIELVSVASQMDDLGWIVRSGHAQGAHQAWETGHIPTQREIYLPWSNFNVEGAMPEGFHVSPDSPAIRAVAQATHPYWDRLSQGGQKLMMRNVSIILGPNLDDPVQFVAYWSEQKKVAGGTGNAVKLASLYGIPSFNIKFEEDQRAMGTYVDTVHGLA